MTKQPDDDDESDNYDSEDEQTPNFGGQIIARHPEQQAQTRLDRLGRLFPRLTSNLKDILK